MRRRGESIARWAARPIELGGGNRFLPLVLGPSGVPEVTDTAAACADPELAVLSAMAHGQDADAGKALRIAVAAMAASVRLDAERATLYFDLVAASLSEAARKALQSMDPAKYEYQSEFARRYIPEGKAMGEVKGRAEGMAEGTVEGKADLLLKQLAPGHVALSAHRTRRTACRSRAAGCNTACWPDRRRRRTVVVRRTSASGSNGCGARWRRCWWNGW
jgi:hypothetical protein